MASTSATIAKDRGNAAFKSGKWADAIGHYSAAVFADPVNPTYPLNRAAAYLKLAKYHDAERDCTTVIALDARNVKAYYRRAQARIGLDRAADAERDLLDALQIEPANETLIALQKQLANTFPTPYQRAPPERRRTIRNVPIEIVDDQAENQPAAKHGLLAPQAQPSTKTKAPPRVGGAIFHKDGTQTVFRMPEETVAPVPPASTPTPTPLPPQTHFQLTRTWFSLPSPSARFAYLQTIPPSTLPTLFKSSLDSTFLSSLLITLSAIPDAHPSILDYLKAFPAVPRFGTNVLFLSAEEKVMVRRLWERVDSREEEKVARRKWGL